MASSSSSEAGGASAVDAVSVGVHHLPDTLLSLVFACLDSRSLSALSPVCREWHAVTHMPWLWRSWFMARYPRTTLSALNTPTTDEQEHEEEDESEDEEHHRQSHGNDAMLVPSPSAATSHLLSDECAGAVEWRAAFETRAHVQAWSAMFTPPRRRTPQATVAARPFGSAGAAAAAAAAGAEAVSPAPNSGGSASSAVSGSGGRSSHRNQRGSNGGGNGGNSGSNSHERGGSGGNGGSGNIQRGGGGGGGGGGGDGGGIQRSRSTSFTEERAAAQQRHSHSQARRSSMEGSGGAAAASSSSAGEPVAPVLNNHTPPPQRSDRVSGNLTAITHPNQRGVRHSPAPHVASPMQRSRPMPIPSGGGSGGRGHHARQEHRDRDREREQEHHSRSLPPPSASPNFPSSSGSPGAGPRGSPGAHRRLSGSPNIGFAVGVGNLGPEFEELSLGSSALGSTQAVNGDSSMPLILTGHRSAVTCLHFDESRIGVCAGRDVRMYSLRSGQLLEHLCVLKSGLLTSLDFSSTLLVTASTDCALRLFDLETMSLTRVTARKHAHDDVVTAVRLSGNERALVSASLDASLKVFDVEDGQCRTTINQGDTAGTGMLLCMDRIDEHTFLCGASGANAAAAGGGGGGGNGAEQSGPASARIALFDVRAGRVAHVQSIGSAARQQMVCSISYSSSNSALAAGGNDGSVHVLDMRMLTDNREGSGNSSGGGGGSAHAKPVLIHMPTPAQHQAEQLRRTSSPAVVPPPLAPSSLSLPGAPLPLLPLAPSPPTAASMHFETLLSQTTTTAAAPLVAPVPVVVPAALPPSPLVVRAPIQSVHLDSSRLLVCQKRLLSIFSSSSCSPLHGTGLPFAHLERQFGLEDASAFSRPTCAPQLNAFHFMRFDPELGTLALATTDAILVWLNQRHVFNTAGVR